ncbi:hypothetical protein M9H77_07266 [Catharanthus roseus]|uniref:Uncharacterized protein n=1 Tax=Catharanthus roseus TaxID=4058 RepID=A0ACC0BUQ3_CATRO|nr:hypothetical protein M9H77_07266 [Catharanthus roseus]
MSLPGLITGVLSSTVVSKPERDLISLVFNVIRNLPSCFPDLRELLSSVNLAQFFFEKPKPKPGLSPIETPSICALHMFYHPMMSWTEPHNPNRMSLFLTQDAGRGGWQQHNLFFSQMTWLLVLWIEEESVVHFSDTSSDFENNTSQTE